MNQSPSLQSYFLQVSNNVGAWSWPLVSI
jgi:hypothetical protein